MSNPEPLGHPGVAPRRDRDGSDRDHRRACRASWPADDPARSGESSASVGLDPMLAELVDEVTGRILAGEEVDVEGLIARHPACAEAIRGLLPAMRGLAELGDGGATDPFPGADCDEGGRPVFGNFRILREVGRGGMGIVFEAEQLALGRRVALKILPRGLAMDPRALRRFQLEAHIAGGLQHPRIVPVHDVGLVHGVPYYAMQFINGGSLAGLIEELRCLVDGEGASPPASSSGGLGRVAVGLLSGRLDPPRSEVDGEEGAGRRPGPVPAPAPGPDGSTGGHSLRDRSYLRGIARLGLQAAEALDFAHDQGVVHRDVKPANLLVDLRGEIWVADFGMANVQGDAGMTASGELPGTLRYMSPEQALGKRALVDRRTDIYALGATLYELLTLSPAVSGDDRQQILRRIAEEEPAPIRRLNPAVPPDLATVVARAMAKEPSNRYESARQLAEDLGRFLDGRPIVARPIGPLARSWRWCRRRPVQAGLVAALGMALVVGFVGVTWGWREAVRQKRLLLVAEREARDQAARASAINRFLIEGLLERAEPAWNPASERLTLSDALERASERVGAWFEGQPGIEAAIRVAVGRAFHGLGEYSRSEAHYRTALERFEQAGDPEDPGVLEARSELGHVLSHLDRREEGLALLARSLPESRRVLGRSHRLTLQAALYLAEIRLARGELEDAESLYRGCLEDSRDAPEPDPDVEFSARFHLGDIFLRQGRADEAEALYRALADDRRQSRGPMHPETLTTLNNLGVAVEKLGDDEEAERIFRDCLARCRGVFGDRHPETATAQFNLGHVLDKLGRPDEAEPLVRESLDARRIAFGDAHPATRLAGGFLDDLRGGAREQGTGMALGPATDPLGDALDPGHRAMIQAGRGPEAVLGARAGSGEPAP